MFIKNYISRISYRLPQFKENGNDNYSARCVICGDSKTNKHKKRFFIFKHKNEFFVKCFNCGYANSFENFLKYFDYNIYSEFKLEKLKSNDYYKKPVDEKIVTDVKFNNNIFHELDNLEKTNSSIILEYIKSRKIPEHYYSLLYAVDNINKIAAKIEKYKSTKFVESPGIIIPYYNKLNELTYFQNRYIDNKIKPKFLSFEIIENDNKIFNENNLNPNNIITVLEGPIDSLFINNSCAIGGLQHDSKIEYLDLYYTTRIMFDNDYSSNKQVLTQLNKYIEKNYSVVLYDKRFKNLKDVNDAIISSRFNTETINEYINERTFSGLKAKLELAKQLKENR